MSNSRDFVRRLTLFSPPFARGGCWFRGTVQLARQPRHFDCAQPGFKSFVAALQSRAVNGLLQRVAGEHAEHQRDSRIHLSKLQATRSLRTYVIVMSGFAPQYATDRDQRIVTPRGREFFRSQRQFKRARHVNHVHVLARSAPAFQRIHGALQQSLSDKTVEPAYDNPESQSFAAQSTINFRGLNHLISLPRFLYFPLNCAGRFSRNAFVPSRMSSVAQHKPKSVASRNSPSSCGISTPRSIASMQYFTASGAFSIIFLAIAAAAGSNSAGS